MGEEGGASRETSDYSTGLTLHIGRGKRRVGRIPVRKNLRKPQPV